MFSQKREGRTPPGSSISPFWLHGQSSEGHRSGLLVPINGEAGGWIQRHLGRAPMYMLERVSFSPGSESFLSYIMAYDPHPISNILLRTCTFEICYLTVSKLQVFLPQCTVSDPVACRAKSIFMTSLYQRTQAKAFPNPRVKG